MDQYNQYNQVSYKTQDTIWEKGKNARKHHIQESHKVRPFPTGDNMGAKHRHHSIAKININNKNDPQKKHSLGTVSKKFIEGLKLVSQYQPHF